MNNCYCGTLHSFHTCCHKIHLDIKKALTAESLMRSRYSAFVVANGDYLLHSHHSTTRPSNREKKSMVKWATSVQWVKLEILNTTQGLQNDSEGTVEFKAFYFENGSLQCIHENSKFIKENEHWVYLGVV